MFVRNHNALVKTYTNNRDTVLRTGSCGSGRNMTNFVEVCYSDKDAYFTNILFDNEIEATRKMVEIMNNLTKEKNMDAKAIKNIVENTVVGAVAQEARKATKGFIKKASNVITDKDARKSMALKAFILGGVGYGVYKTYKYFKENK